MGKTIAPPMPRLTAALKELGENIYLARRRRRITATMLAERAGMTRTTLYAAERGEPSVSMGSYANILFSLGLEKDLARIGLDDEFGRKLQDAGLLTPSRARRERR